MIFDTDPIFLHNLIRPVNQTWLPRHKDNYLASWRSPSPSASTGTTVVKAGLPRVLHFPIYLRSLPCQMGSSLSRQGSNSRLTTALNKAYADGDSRTYREIEQSIAREKQGQTRGGGGGRSTSQSHDSHSPSLPTPTSHAYQSINSNAMPSRQNYQPLNTPHGYNGSYGVNGQRPQPIPPQGTIHLFSYSTFDAKWPNAKSFPGPTFRHSPFYSVVERLGSVHMCEGIEPVN